MAYNLISIVGFGLNIYFCGSKEFVNYKNWFWRVGFYWLAMTGQRFMYYSVWCLSDAALIACGIAYNGKQNGNNLWDRIYNIGIIDLEINSTSCV